MLAATARWTFVFSHPNHEIAVFGLMQRLKPHFVYLTDGGGAPRVNATRAGLERLGLLDRAVFLNHTEESFYGALVERDSAFWRKVATQVAEAFTADPPEFIGTDAVEFYNPVHDMSLPVVQLARQMTGSAAPIYEVPLVRERTSDGDYVLQTALPEGAETIRLSDDEWGMKWKTWSEVHSTQLPGLSERIGTLGRGGLGEESIHLARDPLRDPGGPEALRYERRGRLLAEKGEVKEVITLEGHVRPVVRNLLAA